MPFTVREKEKVPPMIPCIAKTYNNTNTKYFVTVFKIYSINQIYNSVSNGFKIIYSQIENSIKMLNSYQILKLISISGKIIFYFLTEKNT